jgi:hypothetical protein
MPISSDDYPPRHRKFEQATAAPDEKRDIGSVRCELYCDVCGWRVVLAGSDRRRATSIGREHERSHGA